MGCGFRYLSGSQGAYDSRVLLTVTCRRNCMADGIICEKIWRNTSDMPCGTFRVRNLAAV